MGQSQHPEHRHNACGVGPIFKGFGRPAGVTQVSWSLGTALVTTFRITGTDAGPFVLKSFRSHNRLQGSPFAEVRYAAKQFPNLVTLPALPPTGRFVASTGSPPGIRYHRSRTSSADGIPKCFKPRGNPAASPITSTDRSPGQEAARIRMAGRIATPTGQAAGRCGGFTLE